jgi:hypothetical protein
VCGDALLAAPRLLATPLAERLHAVLGMAHMASETPMRSMAFQVFGDPVPQGSKR